MKIKRIGLMAFGKFKNAEYHFSDDQINLVFGNNEAGKSTLFEAFKALLCGFTPANRERFPYIPWGEDEASLELETYAGELVQRRMRSNITGFYKSESHSEKIQNRPLFDLDRNLLESLYTLEADDLLDIDKRSMEYVFDELSTTFDIPGMVSPKIALENLAQQRRGLYTKHAHSGRPLNMLEMELEELRRELVDIEAAAAIYRKDRSEFDQTETDSLHIALELEELKAQIEHFHELEKKRTEFDQLQKARQAIQQESLSRSLGYEFIERYRQIEFDRHSYAQQLASRRQVRAKLLEDMDRLDEPESTFLREFDDYASGIQRSESELESLRQQINAVQEKQKAQQAEFERLAQHNFSALPAVEGFKYITLSRSRPAWIFPVILAFILAGVGYLAYYFQRSELLWARNVSLGIIGVGVVLGLYLIVQFSRYHRERSRYHLLRGFDPLELGQMAQLATQLQAHKQSLTEAEARLETLTNDYQQALARFEFDSSDQVFTRERALVRKQDREEQQMTQLTSLEREIESIQEKLEYQNSLQAEQNRPLKAYAVSAESAIELLQSDLKAIDFYDELKRQWEADPVSDSELASIEPATLAQLHEQEAALQEHFRKTISQSASARERMRQYEKLKPVEEYRNEIHALEERRSEILYEYNSLSILQAILSQHYERFIENHQPQLLEQASDYLKAFTSGRYQAILTIENEFYLKRANGELIQLASSHSKGIRSQLYLALRLAIIDTVEQSQALPLFFDEAFSNWDNPRLKRTLAVLREIAKERQVFIFTCREEDAAMIEAQSACARIDL